MASEPDTRIITPMPAKLLAAVDDYRFTARLPSRAEAMRRLIELGLQASGLPRIGGAGEDEDGRG